MNKKNLMMTADLYHYVLKLNPQENSHLLTLKDKTDKLKYSRLRSPTEQIHFLTFLLKWIKPKEILELGTFTGYSTLAFALATSETCKITTCDINNVFPSVGIDSWKAANVENRIKLELAPAKETLAKLSRKKIRFDFIYIDADKENNWLYLEQSLLLLEQNGIILVDNVLWHGEVAKTEINDERTIVIRNFNEKLKGLKGINYCLLPIGDGLTMVSKDED